MANTSVTVRIDEKVKTDLQDLMSDLGLDMTDPPTSRQCSASGDDFSSLIMSQCDSDDDSL